VHFFKKYDSLIAEMLTSSPKRDAADQSDGLPVLLVLKSCNPQYRLKGHNTLDHQHVTANINR